MDTIGTQLAVLYTVEPLSIVDTIGTQLAVLCREVSLIQRYVDLYTALCGWGSRQCLIRGFLYSECPL